MLNDEQLLRRYAADGSEDAFGELVARYVNFVYSAALRRASGDSHLAQDVAQLVFTDLARKARALPKGIVLAGWLHRATRYAAAQMMRADRRRQRREQEAIEMNAMNSEAALDWEQIRPMLDEALEYVTDDVYDKTRDCSISVTHRLQRKDIIAPPYPKPFGIDVVYHKIIRKQPITQ